jgi:hypothetical protein
MAGLSVKRYRSFGFCCVLVAVHLALGIRAAGRHGVTHDEPVHVATGYLALTNGDFRIDPIHPPLARLWMTWPLLLQDLAELRFEDEELRLERPPWPHGGIVAPRVMQWIHHTRDARGLFFWPRVCNLLWTTLLIVGIWRLLRQYGELTASLGAAFVALCPNLLAHSALATTDSSAAACYALAALAIWRLTRCMSVGRLFTAGIATAAIVLCKFSGLIIVPVCFALAIARVLLGAPVHWRLGRTLLLRSKVHKAAAMAIGACLVSLQTYLLIWATYGFRFSARSPMAQSGNSSRIESDLTPRFWTRPPAGVAPDRETQPPVGMKFLKTIHDYRLLPETYIHGMATILYHESVRESFLLGEFKMGGTWYYFPVALLLKTPLPTLIFLAGGTFLSLFEIARRRSVATGKGIGIPASISAIVFIAAAIQSEINIGLRHFHPALASLLILSAPAVGIYLRGRRWGRLAAFGGVFWLLACTLSASPDFLSYFNELAGGAEGGHRYLADSNIDWGQGLPDLVDDPGVRRGEVAMFFYRGLDDPAEYGLTIPWSDTAVQFPDSFRAGRYAVSVNLIRGLGLELGPNWAPHHQVDYLILNSRAESGGLAFQDRIVLKRAEVHRIITRLRDKASDGMIGDTFLAYDLSADDLMRLLDPVPD